jgi:hypothetical protein
MKRIVLIADPLRKDTFEYLIKDGDGIEWLILWDYEGIRHELKPGLKILYWKNYKTPADLVKKIKPDRIIFLEIIDMWQIPLIIHCRKYGVATFFLEHGVGNTVEHVLKRFEENQSISDKAAFYFRKLFSSPGRVLRNRRFYYASLADVKSPGSAFSLMLLPLFFKIYTPVKALSRLKFPERTPQYALLFNENNTAPFLIYNLIKKENIVLTGVPFFDGYYSDEVKEENYVLFIEHPYLEEKLLDWNLDFHSKVANALLEFSKKTNTRVIVKLHPRSDIANWRKYNFPEELIMLAQKPLPEKEFINAKLVLGYSSTLVSAALCAKKNVIFLGWHPAPQIFGIDYSETGICHKSLDPNDLNKKYSEWINNNLCVQNPLKYNSFIKSFNYPFDGKATERLISFIKNA